MTRNKKMRVIFAVLMAAIMMVPAAVVSAATGPAVPPPVAIKGPRLNPTPIRHTTTVNPYTPYNWVAGGNVPEALESNAADGGKTQSAVGRGIKQTKTEIGQGITLGNDGSAAKAVVNVCNNFNEQDDWAAAGSPGRNPGSDVWTDWFGGWAPFAINNGYYQSKNVVFTMERVVGPGSNFNDSRAVVAGEEASLKIASHEPFAAGVGSPIIPVPAGYEGGSVMVTANYLIWDHDQGGKQGGPDGLDWDWASMGVKPGAAADHAYYVNGYNRGEWSELTQTVELGDATDVMVLLQGHSPAVLNSNIYFDNVKIGFVSADGSQSVYLTNCVTAESIK
jgi:hypothetical protein